MNVFEQLVKDHMGQKRHHLSSRGYRTDSKAEGKKKLNTVMIGDYMRIQMLRLRTKPSYFLSGKQGNRLLVLTYLFLLFKSFHIQAIQNILTLQNKVQKIFKLFQHV